MTDPMEASVRASMAEYDRQTRDASDATLRRLMVRDRDRVERLVRDVLAERLAAERRRRLH